MLHADPTVSAFIVPNYVEHEAPLGSQFFLQHPNERYIEAVHGRRFKIVVMFFSDFLLKGSRGVKICVDVDDGRMRVEGLIPEMPVIQARGFIDCQLPRPSDDISVSELTFELLKEEDHLKMESRGKIVISIERGDSTPQGSTSAGKGEVNLSPAAGPRTPFRFSPSQEPPIEFTFWYTSRLFLEHHGLIKNTRPTNESTTIVLAPVLGNNSSEVPKPDPSSSPGRFDHNDPLNDEAKASLNIKVEQTNENEEKDSGSPKIKTEGATTFESMLNNPLQMGRHANTLGQNKAQSGRSSLTPIEISDDEGLLFCKKRKARPPEQQRCGRETTVPKRARTNGVKDEPKSHIKQEFEDLDADRIKTEPNSLCKREMNEEDDAKASVKLALREQKAEAERTLLNLEEQIRLLD